ncbi:MAG TPA: hypothetical protein VI259_18920, partial [Gemmatimonadaceae bacterium]
LVETHGLADSPPFWRRPMFLAIALKPNQKVTRCKGETYGLRRAFKQRLKTALANSAFEPRC